MATISDIRIEAGFRPRLVETVKSLFARAAQHSRYRKTVRELQVLSTRELDDLGLNHGDIRRVAFEAAYSVKS
jgi:uncharacterized protein YjiS (DUF1127 family)